MKKLLLIMFAAFFSGSIYAQECSKLFFSEYLEGAGNNKALEIYNPTNGEIDLSQYAIRRYSNGSPVVSDELVLSGTIQSKGVVVVTNGQTDSLWVGTYWSVPIDPALYDKGDLHDAIYPAPMYFNGNDAITLETTIGEIVDIFGKIGSDPGSNGWNDIPPTYYAGDQYWTSWTKDHTLIRKASVKSGVSGNPGTFMVNVEWDSIAKDNFDSLGIHRCDCGTLGVNQNEFKHSIVMYPNPSTSKMVTISASEKIESISVVNQLGQLVFSKEYTNQSTVIIEGEFLSTGIYVVTAKFIDNSVYTNKLVIK
ncbi:MAG: lamin tail domain-containing protein [Bacteroidales bacterium]|nr:lamin tail domain-containing protein [Bacteroidales bacterium]